MSDSPLHNQISGNLELQEILSQFLLAKKIQGITPKTSHYYDAEITRFIKYSQSNDVTNIFDVTPILIREFFSELSKTRGKGGVHATFRPIRIMFNWFELEFEPANWKNPIHKIKIPTPKNVAIAGISMEDFGKLINASKGSTGQRDIALWYCLLDSCARAEEFINLNIEDIDLISGDVLIKAGKGGLPRYVRFGSKTKRELRKYLKNRQDLKPESPLFANKKNKRFSYNSLYSLLRWRCGQAKIDMPGLHDIRRAGALELLRNGADLAFISHYLGHRDVFITMRYLAITPDDLKNVHEKSGPVDNLRI